MTGLYVTTLLIGIVAGLRAMTPLAVLSWAALATCLLVEGN
ncbi:putative membrane protein [Mycobacteroides chelonae]|nr:putative membrane protein [Mycobacteroides chelonae]